MCVCVSSVAVFLLKAQRGNNTTAAGREQGNSAGSHVFCTCARFSVWNADVQQGWLNIWAAIYVRAMFCVSGNFCCWCLIAVREPLSNSMPFSFLCFFLWCQPGHLFTSVLATCRTWLCRILYIYRILGLGEPLWELLHLGDRMSVYCRAASVRLSKSQGLMHAHTHTRGFVQM